MATVRSIRTTPTGTLESATATTSTTSHGVGPYPPDRRPRRPAVRVDPDVRSCLGWSISPARSVARLWIAAPTTWTGSDDTPTTGRSASRRTVGADSRAPWTSTPGVRLTGSRTRGASSDPGYPRPQRTADLGYGCLVQACQVGFVVGGDAFPALGVVGRGRLVGRGSARLVGRRQGAARKDLTRLCYPKTAPLPLDRCYTRDRLS